MRHDEAETSSETDGRRIPPASCAWSNWWDEPLSVFDASYGYLNSNFKRVKNRERNGGLFIQIFFLPVLKSDCVVCWGNYIYWCINSFSNSIDSTPWELLVLADDMDVRRSKPEEAARDKLRAAAVLEIEEFFVAMEGKLVQYYKDKWVLLRNSSHYIFWVWKCSN